jgi:sigma-54-interacting transcriptional regulator
MIADPNDPDFAVDALAILARAHPNMLLIGPIAATDRALELTRPYLRSPTVCWAPLDSRVPPIGPYGTLVIRDVETADAEQQAQLCSWLNECAPTVQVVSTTAAPLFPLVARGAFLERLYYLLNQLCFDLSAKHQA